MIRAFSYSLAALVLLIVALYALPTYLYAIVSTIFRLAWIGRNNRRGYVVLAIVWTSAGGMLALLCLAAFAHDSGQWPDSDLKQWYQSLMQPDVPTASCCGEADAYYCDDYYHSRQRQKSYCRITDDRPDEPRGRPHVAIGTEIEIPNNKLKWDRGNPTGHGVVFISRGGYVFCYVQPGGA